MIKAIKERMIQIIGGLPAMTEAVSKFKDKEKLVLVVMRESKYKTLAQNNFFHSLLREFWKSGKSSYKSYLELRKHYLDIAGLVVTTTTTVKGYKIIQEKIESWSRVKKEFATLAINELINDMFEAKVNSKKFDDILKGAGDAGINIANYNR